MTDRTCSENEGRLAKRAWQSGKDDDERIRGREQLRWIKISVCKRQILAAEVG